MFFHNASNLITSFLDIQWNQHLGGELGPTNINSEWKGVNTTKHHFPSKIWIIRPTWETTLKILSILPIIFVGILANGALIYIIIRAKSLHTTTNLLIVNMAIADICTCILCPWMFLCVDLYQNYILGPIGCRLDGFIVHALTLVAVFNLSVVSYDRLSAIVLNCSSRLTKRSTHLLLYAIWISGIGVATPLCLFRSYYERQWSDFLETYCTENTVVLYPYWHVFAGLTVWAPLTIMAICYSSILIKLDRFESQALRSKYPIIVRYKGKVARALGIIVLAFILCRVPFTVLIIQRARLLQQPSKPGQAESMYFLWYISRYLVLVNAAINPLLYGCSSSSLRKELAICPATSWLIYKRKKKIQKQHSNQQCNSEPFNCLKPRSPCIRVNYYQRSIIPNISSRVSPINLDLSPN
ncbi:PREDICTED: neuropeptide FF receptor 2-like [Polistes dominula]|uniref:Neuropeptide FF receptor 2-like n=1 Tax=Polistes dominula TaxID=743375 RepID=A0ABM1I365_POLDO|nr:PREDICTED: neuropeptide FF receptor 2-like [Polistes dominula]